nr:hypothetical protein Iba_chr13dCG1600 [Ipomoea batatas]
MVLSASTSAAPLASSLSSNKKATAATCLSKVPEEANQLQTALSSTGGLDPVFKFPALTAWFLVTHGNAESDFIGQVWRSMTTEDTFLNDLDRNFDVSKHTHPFTL